MEYPVEEFFRDIEAIEEALREKKVIRFPPRFYLKDDNGTLRKIVFNPKTELFKTTIYFAGLPLHRHVRPTNPIIPILRSRLQ